MLDNTQQKLWGLCTDNAKERSNIYKLKETFNDHTLYDQMKEACDTATTEFNDKYKKLQ